MLVDPPPVLVPGFPDPRTNDSGTEHTGGRPFATEQAWLDNVRKTIWLIRPDLRDHCGQDWERFNAWLLLNGAAEYRALAEISEEQRARDLESEPAEEAFPDVRPRLTRLMKQAWSLLPDLKTVFDLATPEGQRDFATWLIVHGRRQSDGWADLALAVARPLLSEPAPEAVPGQYPVLTRFMTMVHRARADLPNAFNLATPEGQRDFAWWVFINGPGELGLARYITDEQKRFLNEPDESLPADTPIPISRLMRQIWLRRPDLQAAFPLDQAGGRAGFLAWYVVHGVGELQLAEVIDAPMAGELLAPAGEALPVPRVLSLLWTGDVALQERFPDPAAPDFRLWADGEGRARYPVLARLAKLAATPAQGTPAPAVRNGRGDLPFGVNLIGAARGQFGIGEDVRMAAHAMRVAGIPFSIYNVDPGPSVCQGDDSVEGLIGDGLPYAVNMICTTGIETARLAAFEGRRLFDGRPAIGFWPWELPEWPREWRHAYDLVDEVWASTRYTYQAYAASCPRTVRHMPMTVTVDASDGLGRRDFGLPENRFLFVFSFDALSSFFRKNPEACVQAFRMAFPRGDEPVGLVIKAMRATGENPVWLSMLDTAAADRRMTIIGRTLTRGAVLDLYRACDCFVSLHRAEGFGRGIADAMMLGKPVIVTGHSGNLDFTTPGCAALVDHRPRPVGADEYPFAAGQMWVEPSVEHAAWWMRRLFEEAQLRERLAEQGRRLTMATYAPEVVGAHYAAVLRQVMSGQGISGRRTSEWRCQPEAAQTDHDSNQHLIRGFQR